MCNLHWCYTFCTGVTLFALVLHLNCTVPNQSESSNFFMYIIKRNTDRKPFEILIDREDTLPFCPVKSLVEYCKLRGALPGPLFCQQNLTPTTVYQFNTEVSRCLQFCGLDTTRYKGHSLRIGAASLAADKVFSEAQIRTLERP